jgi:hypothetical protein
MFSWHDSKQFPTASCSHSSVNWPPLFSLRPRCWLVAIGLPAALPFLCCISRPDSVTLYPPGRGKWMFQSLSPVDVSSEIRSFAYLSRVHRLACMMYRRIDGPNVIFLWSSCLVNCELWIVASVEQFLGRGNNFFSVPPLYRKLIIEEWASGIPTVLEDRDMQ